MRGSVTDLTAFPVAAGEDAWPADQTPCGTPGMKGTFERVDW